MPNFDSGRAASLGGISIQQRRGSDLNGIRFADARSAAPTSANDLVLYRRGTTLYWWNGTSEDAIGAAGGVGAIPTWETLFATVPPC